ncbi:MAG: hypothetical protein ACRC41_10225 [Sarcina sp.]
MKISIKNLIALIIISIVSIIYGIFLGSTPVERVGAIILLAAVPLITILAFWLEHTRGKRIFLGVLFALAVIILLIAGFIIIASGAFGVAPGGFSYKAAGMLALVFCPLLIAYICLLILQYREMSNKYGGRYRNRVRITF